LVPLNSRLADRELLAILDDCRPRVLITDRDPGRLPSAVERVVSIPDGYEELVENGTGAVASAPEISESTVAALFYTGGTTGTSKGVMLTHRNLVANAMHKIVACSLTPEDRFLAFAAMYHVAGVAPLVG